MCVIIIVDVAWFSKCEEVSSILYGWYVLRDGSWWLQQISFSIQCESIEISKYLYWKKKWREFITKEWMTHTHKYITLPVIINLFIEIS